MKLRMTNKILWYPGSAYSDASWIKHLNELFTDTGLTYVYTDMNNFDWNAPARSILCSGFRTEELISSLQNEQETLFPLNLENTNVLVLSNHPGFKSTNDILESRILSAANPKILIYRNLGTILENPELIAEFGYRELWLNEGEHFYQVFIQERFAEPAIKALLECGCSNNSLLKNAMKLPRQN